MPHEKDVRVDQALEKLEKDPVDPSIGGGGVSIVQSCISHVFIDRGQFSPCLFRSWARDQQSEISWATDYPSTVA